MHASSPLASVGLKPPSAQPVGPTPWAPFEEWAVSRSNGPAIHAYFAGDRHQRKPLVVLVQGSQCLPLFMIGKRPDGRDRRVSTALYSEFTAAQLERVHVVWVERRGLQSFGPLPSSEEEGERLARCSAEHGGVSKRERVADVAAVAEAFAEKPFVESIYVVGHSEGAYVAGGVVKQLGHSVKAVGLLSGPGPTQFFDWLVQARRDNDPQAAVQVFSDMIWLTGASANGAYRGAAIARQLTYSIESTSIDDLAQSKVPIFVAQGTVDSKAPVESADLFVAEALRDRDRRIRYLMLPGLDHGYRDAKSGEDYAPQVLDAFLDWALGGAKGRSVVAGFAPMEQATARSVE